MTPVKRARSAAAKRSSVIPCGVAVIRRGKKFLIAQRKHDDTLALLWEFPGGKKNRGETFEECAVRETREETGVEIAVDSKFMDIRHRYGSKVIWLHFYLCRHLSGDPTPIECRQARWVTLEELKKYPFPPANGPVIARLLTEEKGSA